jgi:thioredoxin 1
MSPTIIDLTDATFDEQVGSATTPILVDFWAEWCAPCKKIAPVLEEISNEQEGRITIAKLNIDENPGIAQRFGVMSIPTLLLFKDGELASTMVGAKGKYQMMSELEAHL